MKITNLHNLPNALVELASQEEEFDEGEVRVTQLLNGLRATELLRRYGKDIEMDVDDMDFILLGTSFHSILENSTPVEGEIRENRLKMDIAGVKLTGKTDVFKEGVITDWKTCKTWKIIKQDFNDWEKQLALYTILWETHGHPVHEAQIFAMATDFSKLKALRDKDYPKSAFFHISYHFTPQDLEKVYKWAEDRIKKLLALRDVPDNKLPLCTDKERFNDGTKYAVMKKGSPRAKKLCTTMEEAERYLREKNLDSIEERKGQDTKCLYYCMARSVCPYAKKLRGE